MQLQKSQSKFVARQHHFRLLLYFERIRFVFHTRKWPIDYSIDDEPWQADTTMLKLNHCCVVVEMVVALRFSYALCALFSCGKWKRMEELEAKRRSEQQNALAKNSNRRIKKGGSNRIWLRIKPKPGERQQLNGSNSSRLDRMNMTFLRA